MTLWFVHHNPYGFAREKLRLNLDANPSPAVLAGGIDGDCASHYWLEDDGMERNKANGNAVKPPYRVPPMEEIRAIPWNGFTVVSTFSGCGGSCLGYRMAGYRVLWANEFLEAARQCYAANMPETILDPRSVRNVRPEEILEAVGKKPGEIDIMDGSPPCQAFSTAGRREKGWGKIKRHTSEDEHAQTVDDLFFEYARILRGLQPRVFVAENVSGLVKGTAKGYFKLILRELKSCGYRVQARLLDAQWLGVPQMRQRIIFVGVREDLGLDPAFPKPLPYRYSVREAIPWISRHGTSMDLNDWRENPDPARTMIDSGSRPAPTVTTESGMAGAGYVEAERIRIINDHNGQFNNTENTVDIPSPTIVADGHSKLRVSGDARVVHDTGGFVRNKDITDRPCPTVTVGVNSLNSTHFRVEGANGFNGHDSADVSESPMPTIQAGRPVHVEGDISGHAIAEEWDRIKEGETSGKYFNLTKPDREKPCPTVTGMGGNVGMASVVHPVERRKFTIAELRRICAFPDDFVLVGSYAQQWARLGNAVPPAMMMHISAAVRDGILAKVSEGTRTEQPEDPAGVAAGIGRDGMLANPHDGPPGAPKPGTVAAVAPGVGGELGDPVPPVRRRRPAARRARVQE